MKPQKTIVYIVSSPRSGSTLIENVLSKSPEMISLGELYYLGGHIQRIGPGHAWDWKCSCGASIIECEFWSQVFHKIGIEDARSIIDTKTLNPKGNPERTASENSEIKNLLNRIYEAVFEISGLDIIVDSSKVAYHGAFLSENSPYRFKFIHLKRDVRAIAISKSNWNKKYNRKQVRLMKLLAGTFLQRRSYNKILQNVPKQDVFEMNYEEFFYNPQDSIDKIAKFIGFQSYKAPEFMELNNDHTIAGTLNRFKKRKIKYDDRWKTVTKKRPLFNLLGYVLNKVG